MSSPFQIFRKNQKVLLVVAGVILMFVFVIGDPLANYIGGVSQRAEYQSGYAPSETAVVWAGGELTNQDLSGLVTRRIVLNNFLRTLYLTGRDAALLAGSQAIMPTVQIMIREQETPEQNVEQHVLQTQVLAQAAEQLGMTVSDAYIRHYLHEVGLRRISSEQMRAILAGLQVYNRPVSDNYIFDALRDELLAHNYLSSYQFGMETVMPQQRWQDWLRVNDRIEVEAAVVPVQTLVVDVREPSEEDLRVFYEDHKENERRPELIDNTELPSPQPAFAQPRKIEIQYLKADFNQFIPVLADQVTDEEIETYYEANKDPQFIRADTGLIGVPEAGPAVDGDEPADADATSTDAESQPADDGGPGLFEGLLDESDSEAPADSTESATSSGEATRGDAAEEAAEAAGTADDSQPTEGTASGEANQPAADDAEAAQEEATSQQVPAQSPGTEEATAEQSPEPPDSSASTDAQDQPAAEAAAETESEQTADGQSVPPATGETPAADAEAPQEYQPLDEVRDEIRDLLAQQRVASHIIDLTNQIRSDLNAAYTRWLGEALDAEEAGQPRPPVPDTLQNLEALAEEHGLEFGSTDLLSYFELVETPVGQSVDNERYNAPLARIFFAQDSNRDLMELYQPLATYDLDGNRYVSIKVNDTPRVVPELAEIRDEVVRQWKLTQAADLALERAEELAAEAQQSGLSLANEFAGDAYEVTATDPFSWLTPGITSPQDGSVFFRLSQPEGIQAPGPEFMREVFGLGEGEVGAVLNHDHTIAYVVRVIAHELSEDVLRQRYLQQADLWFGLQSMTMFHGRQAANAVVGELMTAANVDWLRPPDTTGEDVVN